MSSKLSNFKDLIIGQFGLRMVHTLVVRVITMLKLFKGIFAPSVPSKVFEKAMGGIAIAVAALVSRRAWPDKRQQDESMYTNGRMSSLVKQSHNGITKAHSWFKHSLGCADNEPTTLTSLSVRAHRAAVTHIVSRKARNWFKNFVIRVKMGITHGRNLLLGFGFGEGRIPARTGVRPVLFILPQLVEMAT